MERRHDASDHVLCVVSDAYRGRPTHPRTQRCSLAGAANGRACAPRRVERRLPTLSVTSPRELFGAPATRRACCSATSWRPRRPTEAAAFPGRPRRSTSRFHVPKHFLVRDGSLRRSRGARALRGARRHHRVAGLRALHDDSRAAMRSHRAEQRRDVLIRRRRSPRCAPTCWRWAAARWVGPRRMRSPPSPWSPSGCRQRARASLLISDNAPRASAAAALRAACWRRRGGARPTILHGRELNNLQPSPEPGRLARGALPLSSAAAIHGRRSARIIRTRRLASAPSPPASAQGTSPGRGRFRALTDIREARSARTSCNGHRPQPSRQPATRAGRPPRVRGAPRRALATTMLRSAEPSELRQSSTTSPPAPQAGRPRRGRPLFEPRWRSTSPRSPLTSPTRRCLKTSQSASVPGAFAAARPLFGAGGINEVLGADIPTGDEPHNLYPSAAPLATSPRRAPVRRALASRGGFGQHPTRDEPPQPRPAARSRAIDPASGRPPPAPPAPRRTP